MADNNINDIFGDFEYKAASPSDKKFFPWHKPRKQFVRRGQWIEQLQLMLETGFEDASEITYLGLPGHDLLDLRCIHTNICENNGIKLRFLGFNNIAGTNSDEATDLNISLDEMLKSDLVSSRSEIIPDDFKDIGKSKSMAYQKLLSHGPFDVVNLDLCDGFANGQPGAMVDSHYNAMQNLMTLQHKRVKPWLLFLTTKVSSYDVHRDVMRKFRDIYTQNLDTCAPFEDGSSKNFGISRGDDLDRLDDCELTLLRVFLVGLCKWFAAYNLDFRPQVISEVKSVIGYKVFEGSPTQDLVSIAIKFDPNQTPNVDSFGLGAMAAEYVDECSLAPKILKRIASITDADDVLDTNQAVKEQMVEETIELLSAARYDPVSVRAWITNGCK